jgi:hypothetical protein
MDGWMDRSIDLLTVDIESLALSIWGVPRTNLALRQIILTAVLRRFPQDLQVIVGTVRKIRPRQSVHPLFSPLTFQSLAINLRTTRFNIQKFCVVLTLRLCFVRISQQTSTFAFNSLSRLILYNRD